MLFPGFYGNAAVRDTLSAAWKAGRLPHALLLQGEDGLGKHTLASLLAQAAVCTAPREQAPCGACPACIRCRAGSHPDIAVAQGSGKTGAVSIEEVRRLRLWAAKKPGEAKRRVILFPHMEKMLPAAQNALLKILEEPPADVLFLLTTVSASAVLPTIQSRTQLLSLSPLSGEELFVAAREQAPKADPTRIRSLIPSCAGNLGKLLHLLSEKEGESAEETAEKLTMALLSPGESELMALSSLFIKDRARFREILLQLQWIARDACALRLHAPVLFGSPAAAALSETLTRERLIQLPDLLETTLRYLDQNCNLTLLVTWFCARLRTAAGR